jgi:hypothetical protein
MEKTFFHQAFTFFLMEKIFFHQVHGNSIRITIFSWELIIFSLWKNLISLWKKDFSTRDFFYAR